MPLALQGVTTIAALLSVMAMCAYPAMSGEGLFRAIVKSTAVGCLALIAALWGMAGLAIAFALCTIGDFALARIGDRWFLAGMAAFALGHLAFAVVFCLADPMAGAETFRIIAGLFVVIVAIGLGVLFSRHADDMRWPVRVYVAIIAVMALAALRFGAPLIICGALAFMASDAIIGQQKFLKQSWIGQDIAIWGLYCVAQALLLLGGFYQFL